MSFEHAWVLLLASVPIAWAAWEWQSAGSRTALALKAASLVAVILALADPRLTFLSTRVAVAILADTSRSVLRRTWRAHRQWRRKSRRRAA